MAQTVYRPIAEESKAIVHYSASSVISAAQRNSAVATGDRYSLVIRQPCQYSYSSISILALESRFKRISISAFDSPFKA
jgi:hypothetical protein